MRYSKPEVSVLGPAVVTILGSRSGTGDQGGDNKNGPADCELDD